MIKVNLRFLFKFQMSYLTLLINLFPVCSTECLDIMQNEQFN